MIDCWRGDGSCTLAQVSLERFGLRYDQNLLYGCLYFSGGLFWMNITDFSQEKCTLSNFFCSSAHNELKSPYKYLCNESALYIFM